MGSGVSKSGGGGGGGGARNARQGGGGGAQSLPSLEGTGSAKQVQYANDLREGAYKQLDHMEQDYDRQKSYGLSDNSIGYTKQDVAQARQQLTKELSDPRAANARFIIDNRTSLYGDNITNMVKQFARIRKKK